MVNEIPIKIAWNAVITAFNIHLRYHFELYLKIVEVGADKFVVSADSITI